MEKADAHASETPAVGSPHYRAVISARRSALRRQLDAFLPSNAAIVWELGSGHGHFLTAYAHAHPEKLCVGVDIIGERVERAERKRDRAKLANLHFLHAEARLFLTTLPAAAGFSEVFVLFPDPWPKLRHHKHRIMQTEFLHEVAGRARPGCRLYFRTDHEAYFASTRAIVAAHPKWQVSEDAWPFEFQTVFQSRAPSFFSLVARLRS